MTPEQRRFAEAVVARLRAAREAAGITQEQAAEVLGLHRPGVTEIEAGRRHLRIHELVELARLYGVTVGSLLGEGRGEI